ncbi:HDOD domain-containing protein [Fontimonas sp. SYSU GA230001]|uniref:protein kinase domain-containing protein n=1 Tax=Fontimonas sp. SYSU GA230001 TaxID=3142450 RepID=UPI0032B5BD31
MQKVGKFAIEKVLGRGASAVVYLASDPLLRRPVALKLLKPGRHSGSAPNTSALLNEARACGQLKHPHIVPVYEAGEAEGRAYLAFEYVEGQTLAHLLREHGPLPPAQAAQLMCGVLDALQHAHDAGLVHRDLKPSNILISGDGAPHVTDFGIATRIDGEPGSRELCGTPGYMAPEYIRDGTIAPQGDVFAAGLVLFEMLTGRPAIAADNPFQAMHLIANVPLALPEGLDQSLLDILAKATARDPQLRYAGARPMREALLAYLKPADTTPGGTKTRAGTLDFLLRRMRQKSDFPAMSAAISTINRLAASSDSSASQLAATVLKDFALTNKILRLANSSLYPQTQGRRVSTVSRAVVVLGFDTVRSIAISLMLFEHMQDRRQAGQLRDEFLRANLAGMLARTLAPAVGASDEEAFICALFHNLGRLLARYYLHEEADAIDRLMLSENLAEDSASRRILGLSYEQLGVGVAETWEFPPSLLRSMRHPAPGPVPSPADADDALRALSAYANELAQICELADESRRAEALLALEQRYRRALDVPAARVASAVEESLTRVRELAGTLGLDLRGSSLAGRLAPPAAAPQRDAAAPIPGRLEEAAVADPLRAAASADVAAALSAGIQDLTQALIEDATLDDLLRIVAETLFRAIHCQRVLICTRDPATAQMRARFCLGACAQDALGRFRFPIGGADLFNLILARDVDILISNTAEPKVQNHLPDWYRRDFNAASFIVFPMKLRGVPAAMLYADHGEVGGIRLTDSELALLRTLRNQTVLALKQAG